MFITICGPGLLRICVASAMLATLFCLQTLAAPAECAPARPAGQAQQRADTASFSIFDTTLPDLEVKASNFKQEVVVPQRLTGGELERLSAHSVADAMRYFSGVQLKDYGGVGGIKTLDLRSMGTNHLGVFYDGLPLGNAQNGQIDLGKYSLENVEEISLYNAQKSSIFQPAKDFASAGSVYIRTRRPKFPGTRRVAGAVGFKTGSFGLVNPSGRIDWKISESLSATANAEYTHATGRYRFRYRRVYPSGRVAWDTTATRHNGDIHALRLEAGLFGRLSGGSWMAKAYCYDSDKGIPGAIVNNVWKNSQRQWDRNFFLQGQYRKSVSSTVDVMANAKYACDRMRYLNPDTTLMYTDNTFLQHEGYASGALRWAMSDRWSAAGAADWQVNSLSSTMRGFARPLRHTLLASGAAAYDGPSVRLRASAVLTEVWDKVRPVSGAARRSNLHRLTPALFAAWCPDQEWLPEVRVFWKKAFRMPTFNDLYYTDIGNAALKPESATQYDLGVTWRLPAVSIAKQLQVSADAYFNRVEDKIIAVPKGTGQYRWMMMNLGLVHIFGLEAGCQSSWTLPGEVGARLRINYTYQRAQDRTDPTDNLDRAGTYGGQIAYIPRHSGSAAASLTWRGAQLNYSWIYVGERYDNSSNIPANLVEPWYTSDLSASYPLSMGRTQLSFTLEINNLFDQQYEVIANYPMPGRNFKLITKWIF